MRKVFLVLFCLSFVSSMAWADHPEGDPKPEADVVGVNFSIEELEFSFQKILAGSFTTDEGQVEFTISKDFEMLRAEVTQGQYFSVTGESPSHDARYALSEFCENWDKERKICPDYPVDGVSWNDAKEFIRLLNASEGIEGCEGTPKDPKGCYRLPTGAEYDWAVRGINSVAMEYVFWNDSSQDNYVVFWDNSGRWTYKVATGLDNPKPGEELVENVWEWVEAYEYKLKIGKDTFIKNSECVYSEECRFLRGGSWFTYLSIFQGPHLKDPGFSGIGFRLVRTL